MEKGTPIFIPQVLKHVAEDKSYSWGIYQCQIRGKSYLRNMGQNKTNIMWWHHMIKVTMKEV
jgi:hypothetical protein